MEFGILGFGVPGFGIWDFGIVGFRVLGFVVEFRILGFGIPGVGVPGFGAEFGFLGFEVPGFGIWVGIRDLGFGAKFGILAFGDLGQNLEFWYFGLWGFWGALTPVCPTATLDGGLGLLLPMQEKTYRRLLMLQNALSSALPHLAGLNPRAFR